MCYNCLHADVVMQYDEQEKVLEFIYLTNQFTLVTFHVKVYFINDELFWFASM